MRIHWSIPVVAASVIVTAAVYFSIPGHAEPSDAKVVNYAASVATAVCGTLADFPTLPGVQGVLQGVKQDSGFTDYETGEAVAIAVKLGCPRFIPLLQRFADTYAGGTSI